MRCERAREAIVLRGVGILDPAEHAALQRHLEGCNGCVEATRAEERLRGDFAALRGRVPVPVRLEERVLRAVRDLEPGSEDRVTWAQLLPAGAAAAAGAAGLGWALWAWRDAFAAAGDATARLAAAARDVLAGAGADLLAAASGAAGAAGSAAAAEQTLVAGLVAGAAVGYAMTGATVAWLVGRNLLLAARTDRGAPR